MDRYCQDCIDRLRPTDPRVRPTMPVRGRYQNSICYGCGYYAPGNFDSEDEQQSPRPIVNITYQMGANKTPAFKELAERISKVQVGLNLHIDASRKKNADRFKKYT